MKLYEISESHRELEKLSEEGLDVGDTFEAIEGEFNDKAISLIHVINNMEGNVATIDKELERLTKMKTGIANRQNSLREYLRINMESTGITKIECPLFKISLRNGRDIVSVDDVDKIPPEYMNIKTSFTPMKKEILALLKSGNKIDGVSIIKSKSSISIK